MGDSKQKLLRLSSVGNQEPDVSETHRQKLYDGFVVMAKILAKEMAKELKAIPESKDRVPCRRN